MRIIAGTARGRRLKAPAGQGTRPTTDRVREALMSSITSIRGGFDGAVVLDAYAGSGALSLECISRGACFAMLCDTSNDARQAISGNIEACGFGGAARVLGIDVSKRVPSCPKGLYDLVFLDPPYAFSPAEALRPIAVAAGQCLLAPQVLVIYEHGSGCEGDVDLQAQSLGLTLVRRKKFGDTVVDIFQRGSRL